MGRLASGKLTERITIYKNVPEVVAGGDGQPVEVQTTVGTRWAEVVQLTGRERFYAKQTQSDATWKVTVRNDSVTDDIDATYWIKTSSGLRLNVIHVIADDEAIELECKETV